MARSLCTAHPPPSGDASINLSCPHPWPGPAAARTSERALDVRPDTITYVGHATTLIDVASTRLLTDPVLRGRVAHLRRIAPPAPPAADLQADAVLVSH